jgi:hypothetical protein
MRSRSSLTIRLEVGAEDFLAALALARLRLRRQIRRRRSPIRCWIGLHHWSAFELRPPGLTFRARCRRPGCRAVKIYRINGERRIPWGSSWMM